MRTNKSKGVEGSPDKGIMAFLKYVIFVIKKDYGQKLLIRRHEKFGGDLIYENYSQLEKDFMEKKLHPMDLKQAIAKEINILLDSIRKNPKLKKLYSAAYPN